MLRPSLTSLIPSPVAFVVPRQSTQRLLALTAVLTPRASGPEGRFVVPLQEAFASSIPGLVISLEAGTNDPRSGGPTLPMCRSSATSPTAAGPHR